MRGDIAFVQSMLETGWLGFAGSQIPPDAYNYAGHLRVRRPHRSAELRARRLVRRAGAWERRSTACSCRSSCCAATPTRRAKTAPGRFISAPSDRAGPAPFWEYFGGHNCPCGKLIWASADDYGMRIIQLYSQALVESGMAGACVPYAPPVAGATSGTGYWDVTQRLRSCHPFGDAQFFGDTRSMRLEQRAHRR